MPHTMEGWQEPIITVATATTAIQETESVATGERRFLNRVAVRNRTRVNADVLVSIARARQTLVVAFIRALPANEFVTEQIETWLYEGQYVEFSWSNIQSDDVLDAQVVGHVRELERA